MKIIDCALKRLGLRNGTLILVVSLVVASGLLAFSGCGGKKKVSLEYSKDSSSLVLRVSEGGGLPHPADDMIPVFRLYGDGRVIKWEGKGFLGMLKEARLKQEDVENLLQQISYTGFFELENEYRDPQVYDATYREISVNLVEGEKTVRVWYPGEKVRGFEEAYQLIMGYPLETTTDYTPEKGYLVVEKSPLEAQGKPQFLDSSSEVYRFLPQASLLAQASDSRTAIAIDGASLVAMKKYQAMQGFSGLTIPFGDYVLTVYPVYEPRMAKKPE